MPRRFSHILLCLLVLLYLLESCYAGKQKKVQSRKKNDPHSQGSSQGEELCATDSNGKRWLRKTKKCLDKMRAKKMTPSQATPGNKNEPSQERTRTNVRSDTKDVKDSQYVDYEEKFNEHSKTDEKDIKDLPYRGYVKLNEHEQDPSSTEVSSDKDGANSHSPGKISVLFGDTPDNICMNSNSTAPHLNSTINEANRAKSLIQGYSPEEDHKEDSDAPDNIYTNSNSTASRLGSTNGVNIWIHGPVPQAGKDDEVPAPGTKACDDDDTAHSPPSSPSDAEIEAVNLQSAEPPSPPRLLRGVVVVRSVERSDLKMAAISLCALSCLSILILIAIVQAICFLRHRCRRTRKYHSLTFQEAIFPVQK